MTNHALDKVTPSATLMDAMVCISRNAALRLFRSNLLQFLVICFLWAPINAAAAVVVTPATGPIYGGATVTITGTGFVSDPVTEIYLGSSLATNLVIIDDTTLTVTTPVGPSAGPVAVDVFFQSMTNDYTANAYTYEDVSITSVTPSAGPLSGGTSVTILGNHFAAPLTVAFGPNQAVTVNVIDSQTLSVITPPESMTPGPVDVVVTLTSAMATATLANGFTYGQPSVTDILPTSGPLSGSTAITINGSGFSGVSTVDINIDGIPATGVTIVSDVVMTAITPSGMTLGPVDVDIQYDSGASGSTFLPGGFTYEDVTVTSATPSSGPILGGTTVTILGTLFSEPLTVTFDGVQATTVSVVDSQTLSVVTPPASMLAGLVDVVVSTTAPAATGTLINGFTYVQPTVSGVNPSNGPLYGGTPFAISGSGFSDITTVEIMVDRLSATGITIVDDNTITATTPQGLISGPTDINLQYDSGASGADFLAGAFTYDNISITSISPLQGPAGGGTQLRVEGSLFTSPMSVLIGGVSATDINVLDEGLLLVTTPSGVSSTTVDVSLSVPGTPVSATLANVFSYAASNIGSITPSTGSTQGGALVTINGSDMPNNATVSFGGVLATNVTLIDKDTLSAIAPPNSAGTITVSVSDASGTLNLPNAFTYVAPPPQISSISPSSGLAAGGSNVTISGSDFQSGLSATIGGQNLTALAYVDSNTVTGAVPVLPLGTADVTVTNSDGQSTTFPAGFNVVSQLPQVSNVAGDVAPYGAPDGALNAGDLVIMQQFVTGSKTPTAQELLVADVAPLNSPDGTLNVGDSLVLTRAVLGQITLNPISNGSGTPSVDSATPVSGQNPYVISGTALPNTTVSIYVNGVVQQQVTSDGSGVYTANVVLEDGQNAIYASADDGTGNITTTNQVQATYENNISRSQGGIVPTDTAWTAGSPPQAYRITSDLVITAGTRLTLQPGVVLEFDDNVGLVINGELQVLGSPEQPVTFTSSNQAAPVKGIWTGIQFGATSGNSVIDGAVIEWAVNGITASTASNLVVTNSNIRNYSVSGISFSGGSTGSITNNVINNFDQTGSGILVDQSSPLIDGNTLRNNLYGIDISSASPLVQNNVIQENVIGILIRGDNANPVVSGNTLAANTNYGVQVTGTGLDATNPQPVVSGNNLYGNATAGLYVTGYGSSSSVVLDVTNNWWGDATPVLGNQILVNAGDTPASAVDFSSPQTGISAGPVITGLTVTETYISPSISPGIKDSSTVSATLSEAANWSVNISGGTGIARTFNGSGTTVLANWDGRDNSAVVLPDGRYSVSINATSSSSGLSLVGSHNFTITVDNTVPVADLDYALQNATYQSVLSIPITGSAADTNPSSYQIEYGVGSAPSSWVVISNIQNKNVSSGVLANWAIADTSGLQIPNGLYSVRVTVNDLAGSSSTDVVTIGVQNSLLYNVSAVATTTIRPAFDEMASVSFSVLLPSTTVTYTISDERTGQVVRTLQQVYGASTSNTLAWDGKDDIGNYVPDEAYVYTLAALTGPELQSVTPVSYQNAFGGIIGDFNTSFDPIRNEFWNNNVTLLGLSRVTLCISGTNAQTFCEGTSTDGFKALDGVPFEGGLQIAYWDGYDPSGNPFSGNTYGFYAAAPIPLPINTILVKGTTPFISGENTAPNIEVKSNPYIVTHSYEEQTQIRFQLDQDSVVSVKLLPPGISDANDPSAQILVNAATLSAEVSPGVAQTHTAIWKGYDDSVPVPDTNNILVETEGTYTFTIEATSVVTGLTSIYRGAVTLYH
ncbi:parallel beta-helix repeat protein [Thiogranum longum]|uniref:Parallel beta-helix repeat protein n=1 Tax=Thiogranum longum TaxID=1537524 RepID=A0A4V6NDC1_9GAMM|nr:IPT/TIG domain-containing protein [Thiogranum longum]TCK18886.1 parallel beta-helix repeat protein [Thiogranum longum]